MVFDNSLRNTKSEKNLASSTKESINNINNRLCEGDNQFSDYSVCLNERKQKLFIENQIEFYKKMFENGYEVLNIPKKEKLLMEDSEKENNNESNGYCNEKIDKITREVIDKFIETHGLSKTAFFLSIYGYVLSKYSGQNVIYSAIVEGNKYIKSMMDMLDNAQPILLKYNNENESFIDIMKHSLSDLMNYSSQSISFSEIINTLKLEKVNNLFIYEYNELFISEEESKLTQNEIDFMFIVNEGNNDDYNISIKYNKGIYEFGMIKNIIKSFVEVIKNINTYSQKISEIEYIPKNEKERIIKEFNNNKFEYEFNKVYHEEFRRVAKQYPNKCAIVCGGVEITYKKLDEMTNSLAHYLRSQGIGKGDIVPIISERSQYYIIGLLATMKSGAAYLPIDPEFPKD
ncbi:hypothetical protein PIROE2DRAFT_9692, partial [Piromyces sp. E2]